MPLVPSDVKQTVKVSLEEETARSLENYATFARATKSRVVETAIQRLLADDDAWQAHLKGKS